MQRTEREIKAAKEYAKTIMFPERLGPNLDETLSKAHLDGQQWQKDNAWIAVSSGQLPEKSHQKYSVNVQIWDELADDNDIGYYHFMHEQWYNSHGDRVRVSHWSPLLPAPPKQ